MIDIESLLKDCCAVESGRYAIDKPWKDGTTTYATDGRICVRTRHETSAQKPEMVVPPINELPWDAVYSTKALVMPEQFESDATPIQCSECKGVGCDQCDDTGLTERKWRCFDFGCVGLSEKYLAIVIRHGGTVYPRVAKPAECAVRVVFDDKTDALLMPVFRVYSDVTLVQVPQEAP
jgi:hypothetical protein